ncbi:hypothetical protein [Capnocytophaga leadbetteri]|uniref:hypothetical protein n=1 Tax=Capnocytophaga leadbetteri TaxID=327575 RepID=UPI0026F20E64|nr:hypothetical protein [Capnocytophaga leadbetteri]
MRKTTLLKYQAIMAELDSHNLRDIPITVIWRKYIYPKYFISRKTLYQIIKTMTK